ERTPDPAGLPLAGVRVLDLSRFIAGPLCAQILGDLGAEVIKVERPGGEDARFQGPTVNGEAIYPLVFNRNKLGITLDTRHPAAGGPARPGGGRWGGGTPSAGPPGRGPPRGGVWGWPPPARSTPAWSSRRCRASARRVRSPAGRCSTRSRRRCRD